jgi:hypothetical protein
MASKFAEFISSQKIDPRRLLVVSKQLESLKLEDRQIKLSKRKKGDDDSSKSGEEGEKKAPSKPRSGRPVTRRLLTAATEGGKLSGPGKTRLLRAVNRILEQKKQDPVDIRALF